MPKLSPFASLDEAMAADRFDALVAVSPISTFPDLMALDAAIAPVREIDDRLDKDVTLVFGPELPGKRLVYAPTGPLRRDYDDVRRIGDAARKGVLRARDAGARRPLLLLNSVPAADGFANAMQVSLLESLAGLWEPLEAREALGPTAAEPVEEIGFVAEDGAAIATHVGALEAGRRAARDLAGTEPERMTPMRAVEYATDLFRGTTVNVSVVAGRDAIHANYPLVEAVGRASYVVERHHPRVLRLEYVGEGELEKTFLFAGKGVVYDTGGADVKAGGHMAGMSRDKGGGAAVVGLFAAVDRLRPKGVRLIAEIGFVRNSIGADSFVSDEIITSHAGVRVRIGNTDAEGRLVLADCLSHLRHQAEDAPDPILFSIATLTGHAGRAVGPYGLAVENGPARKRGFAASISNAGDLWGDPFEITRSRREDFDFVRPRTRADDVLSSNNAPSSATARGHQFPMAFLSIASGLDRHGLDADRPLPYVHIDIGGNGVEGGDWQHGKPTGTPILALCAALGLIEG